MFLTPQSIRLAPPPQRIISLVPSITELLSDLQLDAEVVGITKFCVHPNEWFRTKTRIGGTKNVNLKTIESLKPDLIIANKEENKKEQVKKLAKSCDVFLTDVYDLKTALLMIADIGVLANREERSLQIVNRINKEFHQLRDRYNMTGKTKASYFIWQNPYMVAGGDTFINDMMNRSGYENIFSDKRRYPQISIEELKERECEAILLSSEPFPFKEKHKLEMEKKFPGMKIELVDGEMFSWYGSRLVLAPSYFRLLNPS